MDKKCSKYEGLFIFSDEKTLSEHIKTCPECREEHDRMQKVSDLISEVRFHYRRKLSAAKKLKAVCALTLVLFFSATFGVVTYDSDFSDALMYGNTLSAEDLGFPVDSYGLLVVGE